MKASTSFLYSILTLLPCNIHSLSVMGKNPSSSQAIPAGDRRSFMASTAAALLTSYGLTNEAIAASDEEDLIDVYFGCGCFWHVQHEFVEAERRLLGRTDADLTSRAGYAGGNAGALDGKVCYHNARSIADYGKLGHAEVVALRIPPSKFPAFCQEYCALFSAEGYRADQFGDRGLEYRNLVGLPGGVSSVYARQLVETSTQAGDKLSFARGKGDDSDQRALVWVMDSIEYPFYVAEQYHQFHDGFNFGENYPDSYNGLAQKLSRQGTLGKSDCPNGLLGVGALGL